MYVGAGQYVVGTLVYILFKVQSHFYRVCSILNVPLSDLSWPISYFHSLLELEGDHQSGDEESNLSRLLSTPQTSIDLHSSAHETSQPMEYDSVYQSVELDASGTSRRTTALTVKTLHPRSNYASVRMRKRGIW